MDNNAMQINEMTRLAVLENEPLKNHTTFKIGGPAKYFVRAKDKNELFQAVRAAKKLDLPFFILGSGSNVLASDEGFDGLVINANDGNIDIKGNRAIVFAGVGLREFVLQTIENNLSGLDFAGNIPGTVGGAVRGNAGAFGKGVGDFASEVEALKISDHEVSLIKLQKDECQFNYRDSIFKHDNNLIVSEVTFELVKDENAKAKLADIGKELQDRKVKQPYEFPSAGCVFKNVIYTDALEKYKEWMKMGKIAAAKFIDEAGLKGFKIGGAKVSEKHANFVINENNATASDVIQLISLVKMKVRDEFGVQLEEEIQYVGF